MGAVHCQPRLEARGSPDCEGGSLHPKSSQMNQQFVQDRNGYRQKKTSRKLENIGNSKKKVQFDQTNCE